MIKVKVTSSNEVPLSDAKPTVKGWLTKVLRCSTQCSLACPVTEQDMGQQRWIDLHSFVKNLKYAKYFNPSDRIKMIYFIIDPNY